MILINKYDKAILDGLEEIAKDESIDKDIRDRSTDIANRLLFNKTVKEYIVNEWGEEAPYIFVLLEDINSKNGTPILRVEMTNVNRAAEVATYNLSANCEKPIVYTPMKLEAEYDGSNNKIDVIQTLVSAGLSKLQGRFKVEVLEEEDEVTVSRNGGNN